MRLSILTLLALCIAHGNSQGLLGSLGKGFVGFADKFIHGVLSGERGDVCSRDVYQEYRKSQSSINTILYKQVASHSDNNFVFSPFTIWLTLSALAEGADPSVQEDLLKFLNLPQDFYLRKKYYDIALNVERPGRDVSLLRIRELVLDQSLRVNPLWQNFMQSMGLLDVSFAPMKTYAAATAQQLARFISAESNITLSGNSILLDTLDYQGLWTTAFAATSVRDEPFYNDQGQQVGAVNMMRMKKVARWAHIPFMNAKALELPVGVDGRFKMLITVGIGNNFVINTIEVFIESIPQIFALLETSIVPIEIGVPQFTMTTEFDARTLLEEIGLNAFFRDPAATSLVSHPAALPGGFIQRVSINVGPDGFNPPPVANSEDLPSGLLHMASKTAAGLDAAVSHEFIANRPFMFGLFDTNTNTCLFAGAYLSPPRVN